MLLETVSLAVASDYFQKLNAGDKSVCNYRTFHTVLLKCAPLYILLVRVSVVFASDYLHMLT